MILYLLDENVIREMHPRGAPAVRAWLAGVDEWARLIGAKDNNQCDVCLAATARVHDLVLVTRNVTDFAGRGVKVLNPF